MKKRRRRLLVGPTKNKIYSYWRPVAFRWPKAPALTDFQRLHNALWLDWLLCDQIAVEFQVTGAITRLNPMDNERCARINEQMRIMLKEL